MHRSNVELLGVIKGETPDLDTIQKVHFGSELLGVIKGETPDLDARLSRLKAKTTTFVVSETSRRSNYYICSV